MAETFTLKFENIFDLNIEHRMCSFQWKTSMIIYTQIKIVSCIDSVPWVLMDFSIIK